MKDPQHPPAETQKHLLEVVLKLNNLEFDQEFYLQTSGMAMGQKVVPMCSWDNWKSQYWTVVASTNQNTVVSSMTYF